MHFSVIYYFNDQKPNVNNFLDTCLSQANSYGYTIVRIDLRYYISNPCNISIEYFKDGPIEIITNIPGSSYNGGVARVFDYDIV